MSRDVVLSARATADTYLNYACILVDDFLDAEVALHCSFGATGNSTYSVEQELLAVLPGVPVAVFVGTEAYRFCFELKLSIQCFINRTLRDCGQVFVLGRGQCACFVALSYHGD